MTLEKFVHILNQLDPETVYAPYRIDLHSIGFLIAADRWVHETPDDENSTLLREELRYFIAHRKFSWQGEGRTC